MTIYPITQTDRYNFIGESYATRYPNTHKYPATMIPQIGIQLLTELGINKQNDIRLLDPYCGSGSSFTAALEVGISHMQGFDINPLAILIAKAKFTKLNQKTIHIYQQRLRNAVYEFAKQEHNLDRLTAPPDVQ